MVTPNKKLSSTSLAILRLITQGHSYDQILAIQTNLTYRDIFEAAREALSLIGSEAVGDSLVPVAGVKGSQYQERMAKIKKSHPQAYEKWTSEEEARLLDLYNQGWSVEEMAAALQRQQGGIRSRLHKLGLIDNELKKKAANHQLKPAAPAKAFPPSTIAAPASQPEPRSTFPSAVKPTYGMIDDRNEEEENKFFICDRCGNQKRLENSRFINGQILCLGCSGQASTPDHRYRKELYS
jgi:uncharacterized protein (DUF433 family)